MFRSPITTTTRSILGVTTALAITACTEPATSPAVTAAPSVSAVKFWEAGSSVAWNRTARDLIAARNVAAVATQARILAYLSVAQYNAVVAAEDANDGSNHPSPAAAAAGASLVVLKSFFPSSTDAVLLDRQLMAQRSAERWPGEQDRDFAAGEAIGRAVGAEVLAYAATDRVGVAMPPANPGAPGNWTGTNSVRAHYGARTFALTSGDQFRPAPPPVFGSAEFTGALAEVRALSDGLTAEQLVIVREWAPQGPAWLNGVAAELIVQHHRTERESARILALANMAGFDVLNACFDAKFAYWFVRPTQADPMIGLPIPLPNHPSYPSGHSCLTATYATVIASAFPEESERLEAMIVEAGLSRMYAGLHYRFDCEAGQELGRRVAEQVLRTAPKGHGAIPLD